MAAGDTFQGRRIQVPESGDINEVIWDLEPGDYVGPYFGYTGDKPAVAFNLPNAKGPISESGGLHHVTSPPHVFTEQDDGSLEIREAILAQPSNWHGYLDRGHIWREV